MGIEITTKDGVREYSRAKDGSKVFVNAGRELNFKVVEFACKDGSDYLKTDSALVIMLQKIRDHFGKPVIINSAYRNATYNKKIGGAVRSQHIYGKAADICISGVAPIDIARYAESSCELIKGIGLYTWGVHVDTRTTPSKWDSTSGKETAVKTFLTDEKPAGASETYHTIKPGETVWGVCEKYGITIRKFRELNPKLINIALVYPGQKVRTN